MDMSCLTEVRQMYKSQIKRESLGAWDFNQLGDDPTTTKVNGSLGN